MRDIAIPRPIHEGNWNLEFLDEPNRCVETVFYREIEAEGSDLIKSKRRQCISIPVRALPFIQMMKRNVA